MGSLKSQCGTSYLSPIETIVSIDVHCLCVSNDRQTNRQTEGHRDRIKPRLCGRG